MHPSQVRRSHGVAVASVAGGAVAYDAVTDTIHRVGSMGAFLLVDDEPTPVDAFVDDVAAATGTTHGDAESAVLAGIESMRSLGLLDRREPFWVPAPVTGSLLERDDLPTSKPHAVLDRFIVFRSSDQALLW